MRKRYYSIYKKIMLILPLILAFLSGCSQDVSSQNDTIQIGVTVYDSRDTFITALMDHFMDEVSKEVKAGKRISVKRYYADGSQVTQNEQVEEMIKKGCDVICVNLVDRTDPSMIIEAARKANIPVIFFNRELVEKDLSSWNRLYYVGADAFESGTMEGEIAAQAWYSNPAMDKNKDNILQYVVLEGEAGHQDAIVRSEYSVNALLDAGINIDKCGSSIANWNRAQAKLKMGQFLNKFDNSIELVLCNNDDMALGVIDELKAREISKELWPVIVGIDGTDVGLEAVINEEMYGTVYNNKEGQSRAMLQLAIAAVSDEGLRDLQLVDGKYIRYPYERITSENINDFIER